MEEEEFKIEPRLERVSAKSNWPFYTRNVKYPESRKPSSTSVRAVYLGRAALRQSKIVVLDEVSTGVDITTDKLVQRVIREEFKDATIFSVTQRLDTILDFDRIALLSDGKLVEFESPEALLQRPTAFKELYKS